MQQTTKKGFTLAELLIVVAIILILTAITIPILHENKLKAINATNKANIKIARDAITVVGLEGKVNQAPKIHVENNQDEIIWYDVKAGNLKQLRHDAFGNPETGCNNWDWIKKDGIYQYILVYYYEENGEIKVKSKPFIDDKGEVVFGLGENGTPRSKLENAEHRINWYNPEHENKMNVHPDYTMERDDLRSFQITTPYPVKIIE